MFGVLYKPFANVSNSVGGSKDVVIRCQVIQHSAYVVRLLHTPQQYKLSACRDRVSFVVQSQSDSLVFDSEDLCMQWLRGAGRSLSCGFGQLGRKYMLLAICCYFWPRRHIRVRQIRRYNRRRACISQPAGFGFMREDESSLQALCKRKTGWGYYHPLCSCFGRRCGWCAMELLVVSHSRACQLCHCDEEEAGFEWGLMQEYRRGVHGVWTVRCDLFGSLWVSSNRSRLRSFVTFNAKGVFRCPRRFDTVYLLECLKQRPPFCVLLSQRFQLALRPVKHMHVVLLGLAPTAPP